ncbi:unnamed protein product, partial [Prorocentrum cordatum]
MGASGITRPMLIELNSEPDLIFVFDLRPWARKAAVFSILQTLFVCVILLIGALAFSHDANVLVLQPIERMINKVERIRDNPLFAMRLGDETYREAQAQEEEIASAPGENGRWKRCMDSCGACRRRQRSATK